MRAELQEIASKGGRFPSTGRVLGRVLQHWFKIQTEEDDPRNIRWRILFHLSGGTSRKGFKLFFAEDSIGLQSGFQLDREDSRLSHNRQETVELAGGCRRILGFVAGVWQPRNYESDIRICLDLEHANTLQPELKICY
ncbi:hypothetical protein R6Q59_021111 [Mikania micrantha]